MCLAGNVTGGSWTSKDLFIWAPKSSGAHPTSWVSKMSRRPTGSSSLTRCLLLPVFILARNRLTMVFPTLLQPEKGVKKCSVMQSIFQAIYPNFLNFPKGSVEVLGIGSRSWCWVQMTLSNPIHNLSLKIPSDLKFGIQIHKPGNDLFMPNLLNTFDFNLQQHKKKSELCGFQWF